MLGIGGLLALAGCSNGNAAPAPAAKTVVAAPIIPTATPIRTERPDADDGEGDEVEMPVDVVARRARTAANPAPAAPATERSITVKPMREPILSDQLLGDDEPAPAKEAEPIAAPAPEPATEGLSEEDRALIAAATDRPAPAEMIARRDPEVTAKPTTPPRAPVAAAAPTPATEAPAPTRASSVAFGPTTSMSTSSLSPTDVRKTIQRGYLAGIRACHESALEADGSASGTVTAQINVGPDGRVAIARAFGFSSAVDACIKAAARTWRFDVPRDAAGQPTTAPFKIELRLAPR